MNMTLKSMLIRKVNFKTINQRPISERDYCTCNQQETLYIHIKQIYKRNKGPKKGPEPAFFYRLSPLILAHNRKIWHSN